MAKPKEVSMRNLRHWGYVCMWSSSNGSDSDSGSMMNLPGPGQLSLLMRHEAKSIWQRSKQKAHNNLANYAADRIANVGQQTCWWPCKSSAAATPLNATHAASAIWTSPLTNQRTFPCSGPGPCRPGPSPSPSERDPWTTQSCRTLNFTLIRSKSNKISPANSAMIIMMTLSNKFKSHLSRCRWGKKIIAPLKKLN